MDKYALVSLVVFASIFIAIIMFIGNIRDDEMIRQHTMRVELCNERNIPMVECYEWYDKNVLPPVGK